MSTDAFQERHNSFIDSIFMRINRIVSDNYDPFVVRLNGRVAGGITTNAAITGAKTKSTSSNADSKPSKKINNTKSEPRLSYSEPKKVDVQGINENVEINEKKNENENGYEMRTVTSKDNENLLTGDEKLPRSSMPTNANNNNNNNSNNKKQQGKKANNSNKKDGKTKQSGSNQKDNGKQTEKLEKAEGSLSGLASLKRVGNVKVTSDVDGRNSTMKAKFSLGPLVLRVEKSFKRGSVRNVKSATARTNEMIGRIKFSVVNDRATLMSIKVQQPKQVEVESKDNHDRTREFVWRRTPKIAKLVNEKLKLAAEAIFTQKGVEVVRL